MKIELQAIRRGTPAAEAFAAVNEEAFPDAERVPAVKLLDMAETGRMELNAVMRQGEFAGFFSAIQFEEMVYLTFLAISEKYRGKGCGSQTLQAMKQFYAGKRLILDLEAAEVPAGNAEQRQRRKNFYLRNGFLETGYRMEYVGETFEVLCSDGGFSETRFRELIRHIPAKNFRPRLFFRESGADK